MELSPKVSVIIPCRNECQFIRGCLDSILASDYPADRLEVLVADGMSDDGTREILEAYCRAHSNVRVLDNPGRAVSIGLNLAVLAASGEIIVRVDAHTDYARDYIIQCVSVLLETGAQNVGGAAQTKASGFVQEAIQLTYHSPFSVGGARFHNVDYEGFVDTVTYGCWRKKDLIDLGLFDEELVRNQDDELNLRIIRGGGKVFQSKRIRSWYHPRPSLIALFRQYAQYGYWKVRVIQKHKLPASWRHLVPVVWLTTILGLGVLSPFLQEARWALAALLGLYFLASLGASIQASRAAGKLRYIPFLPIVFLVYHVSYGYGFLIGLADFMLMRRPARDTFGKITRAAPGR